MRHRERADLQIVGGDERRERHRLPVQWRLQVDVVERLQIALHGRRHFQHHGVGVGLRVVLRHLTLAEGVVEGGVDHLAAECRSALPDRD